MPKLAALLAANIANEKRVMELIELDDTGRRLREELAKVRRFFQASQDAFSRCILAGHDKLTSIAVYADNNSAFGPDHAILSPAGFTEETLGEVFMLLVRRTPGVSPSGIWPAGLDKGAPFHGEWQLMVQWAQENGLGIWWDKSTQVWAMQIGISPAFTAT